MSIQDCQVKGELNLMVSNIKLNLDVGTADIADFEQMEYKTGMRFTISCVPAIWCKPLKTAIISV
ncbi:MAG: hypothetical protein LDL41_00380 [Coleofasciculus sp. S288]|nr:hypothetical protein [Coleofasciculus sp. S288]